MGIKMAKKGKNKILTKTVWIVRVTPKKKGGN
jgi:hypothetical protein